MKIVYDVIQTMTLEVFADKHNFVMEIRERHQSVGSSLRYIASFKHVEVGGNGFLRSAYGNGGTPEEAMRDYATKISEQFLVYKAYQKSRKEVQAPRLIGE